MRISISYMEEKKKNQYPRLLAKDSKEFSTVKFQKIEFYTKIPKQVDTTRVVLKSLHKTRDSIHSFKLINVQDSTCRERRKSDSDGVMSTKIIHLDLQYPKTMIQQHQFLDKVKDLRRRAIKGRMKTKFQKSIKCMGTTQVSSFNPQHQHTYSSRDSVYGSLQDIKVLRTFAKDRPYYQRPLDKRCSEFAAESPGSPSVQVQRTERKIIFARKQKTFVLLQLSKYKLKPFEQLKRDTIIKLLSDTKETQPHTPAVQTRSTIQNKLQPYFCFPKKRNTKRSCFTSQSQRFKTSS